MIISDTMMHVLCLNLRIPQNEKENITILSITKVDGRNKYIIEGIHSEQSKADPLTMYHVEFEIIL